MVRNNKKMNKILLVCIMFMFLISSTNALDNLGTFKQNECVEIKQTCSSCTYVNFSVSYPNSTRILTNQELNEEGGGLWTYDFCNTSFNGRYEVTGEGDLRGVATSFSTYFIINPAGSISMTSGEGLGLIGSLLVIIVTGLFFFGLSFRTNQPVIKLGLVILSSLILFMSIFYSTIIIQQSLSGFDNIIEGYSTFFFVLKIVGSLALTSLMIFALLVAVRVYKIKRGLLDD